jgi:hypothetical protein
MADEQIEEQELDLDQLTKSDKSVLIRVVEWAEWLPASLKKGNSHSVKIHNGYTAIATGDNEKLLRVEGSGIGDSRTVSETDEKTGETIKHEYGFYVFQATLAQNISDTLAESLMNAQRPPELISEIRDRKDDLFIVQNGVKAPPPPPRKRKRK